MLYVRISSKFVQSSYFQVLHGKIMCRTLEFTGGSVVSWRPGPYSSLHIGDFQSHKLAAVTRERMQLREEVKVNLSNDLL